MPPDPHWLVDFKQRVRKEYEQGNDLRTIAARYDTSKSTIRRYIVSAGGEMRGQGSRAPAVRRGHILNWLKD